MGRRHGATVVLALSLPLAQGCGSDVVFVPSAAGTSTSSSGEGGRGGSGGEGGRGGAPQDCDWLSHAPAPPEIVYGDWVLAILAHQDRLLVAAGVLGVASLAPDGSDFQLITEADLPTELAAANDTAYWAQTASIWSSPIAGGPGSELFAGDSFATQLASDGKNVYFGHAGNPVGVLSVPVGGGSPSVLADVLFPKLATDGERVFFSERFGPSDSGVRLESVPVTGGAPDVVYDSMDPSFEYVGGIALDETSVYFTIGGVRFCCADEPECGCALDECCDWPTPTGRVVRLPKQGGPAEVLTRCVRLPSAIAVDGDDLFVVDAAGRDPSGNLIPDDTRILELAKTPGPPTILVDHEVVGGDIDPQLLAIPGSLAVLDGHLYYVRSEAPYVMRVPR